MARALTRSLPGGLSARPLAVRRPGGAPATHREHAITVSVRPRHRRWCAGEEFFTDANSLTTVRRVRGVRAAFAAQQTVQPAAPGPAAFPLAGNYFPVTSAVFVRDAAAGRELSLVTDRGQGAPLRTFINPEPYIQLYTIV